MSKRKFLILLSTAAIIFYFFIESKSDEKITQSLEILLPQLEKTNLSAYRNQDWCQVIAYNGKAFSNTNESTCVYVTELPTLPFSIEAKEKLKEISEILSHAKIKFRSIENIRTIDGQFVFVEFHKDCSCRTRYVFNPGYGSLPNDVPNELQHFPINENWYRVEEDWN